MVNFDFRFERPAEAELAELARYSSATIHEAIGQRGALPGSIKPIDAAMRLCGPALTVFCPRGDNLMLHVAIADAQEGDILVVDHEGSMDDGPFGDVLASACLARGIAGLVIDGCVRDLSAIKVMGFPVFSRGASILGTKKVRLGSIGQPLRFGDVLINAGDAVVGDEDGLVVVPRGQIASASMLCTAREAKEADMRRALRDGATTLDLLGLRGELQALIDQDLKSHSNH
ncbi:MAG: 4-carboxy-4-hydroxy-2-oxoadipate aldolase/oxaloacetate decarboxylase [Devosia sp.]|jgi:4-hydroxy-4-methyl-2-oxoglutarate aldolase|nr:4-carboxy-4-hydroxy-2-oxoadipate aldolase/oxaloacetate decarboxylase [Devosia sp.]